MSVLEIRQATAREPQGGNPLFKDPVPALSAESVESVVVLPIRERLRVETYGRDK